MEVKYTLENLKISNHAAQRYSERVMDRETHNDVAVFMAAHEQKIKEDIYDMIHYGTLLFSGKSNHEFNKQPVDIFLNGTWIIIVDIAKCNVVTLYSIDLGLGKEFNYEYVSKLKEKLDKAKEEYEEKLMEIKTQKQTYMELIEDNTEQIKQYNQTIKGLQKQNEGYQDIIDTLDYNRITAEKNVKDILATFIGKKIF